MHYRGMVPALIGALLTLTLGCARTAVVIDRSDTSTRLAHCKLEEEPHLKIWMGGALRNIPLKDIRMIEIDPAASMILDREIFYGARVVLKGSSLLHPAKPALDVGPMQCFMCVRNTLRGKRRNETYRIPLEQVVQIKYEK